MLLEPDTDGSPRAAKVWPSEPAQTPLDRLIGNYARAKAFSVIRSPWLLGEGGRSRDGVPAPRSVQIRYPYGQLG